MSAFAQIANAQAIAVSDVPLLSATALHEAIDHELTAGNRIAALFAHRGADDTDPLEIVAVLANDATSGILIARAEPESDRLPSLSPKWPQAHLFESEMAEQWGLIPEGHPWLKPVRVLRKAGTPTHAFSKVEGSEVHEVAVGPVHAGIIEPGHFRFQCHGEEVLHLEIALGYQHRGVERALRSGITMRGINLAETLAGDTTIGHTLAHCQALEALASHRVPARAQAIRAIALELERLANHTGDLGALSSDIGYLPTASHCGRLRGDFLNMSAVVCGNRFGRGLVRMGGVGFDVKDHQRDDLLSRLAATMRDVTEAANLLWDTPSVMARLEETGRVSPDMAEALGLVGPAARASGLKRDVRQSHPTGMYRFSQIPIASSDTGDVFGRAIVRWLEIQRSARFIEQQLRDLPLGATHSAVNPPEDEHMVVSLIEGWRGEICHVVISDSSGARAFHKIVDPSFHNWPGLAMAMRDQQISDFPLCNKSFNLSYCGHDL